MITLITQLREFYLRLLSQPDADTQQKRYSELLNSLRLAESVQRKQALTRQHPTHALQIGVIGPTQSGKSTLVNLLLGSTAAGVSPLAGYTVHAQGFTTQGLASDEAAVDSLFHDFTRVPVDTLDHDNTRQYAVTPIDSSLATGKPTPGSTGGMLWDSPDFDSVESRGYRSAVLRVIALADVLILMVSKDKYADKTVWDMLSLVQPLNKPLIVVINKLAPADTETVLSSFRERYASELDEKRIPPLLTLPYDGDLTRPDSTTATQFRDKVTSLLNDMDIATIRSTSNHGMVDYIESHWEKWLMPVRDELATLKYWREGVDDALLGGLQRYREAYLDHPRKYDTFNRALAELLALLEIPGLAKPLATTRKVITWPVRKLWQLGQSITESKHDDAALPTELEDAVLIQSYQHVVTQLNNLCLDMQQTQQQGSTAAHWWHQMSRELLTQRNGTEQELQQQIDAYQQDFAPEIEAAARRLYTSLQDQPTLLNSLRAARVSADAAAVVVAVKSGGLAAIDLVVAPAMLSVTSLLTESALGKYLETVRNDLKTLQLERVDQTLFDGLIRSRLAQLPETLESTAGICHSGISEEEIDEARQQLERMSAH